MKWVTRERPEIDQLPCPWLIEQFLDASAEIHYVPAGRVLEVAQGAAALPFDVPAVELTHRGSLCSFDAFQEKGRLEEAALRRLAAIVLAADMSTPDRSSQAAEVLAISPPGLGEKLRDDLELLIAGLPTYDALYTRCRLLSTERHGWHALTSEREMHS